MTVTISESMFTLILLDGVLSDWILSCFKKVILFLRMYFVVDYRY